MAVARNSACPCGSGRKYKQCCLAEEKRAAREARLDDAVGQRIQAWSVKAFGDEVKAALEEFVGSDRIMHDDDLQIFSAWFHNDRELPGGGTPAERYAARADLSADERAAAAGIATARLGLYRVVAVEPGSWICLEDILGDLRARVRSANVSRDAVRWDILLGRLMDSDPASLWGPTRLFEPDDEPELLAALGDLAELGSGKADPAEISTAFRSGALELMRFKPSRLSVERSFFTLEGDPVAQGQATWRVGDPALARKRLRALGGLAVGEPLEIEITVPRASLLQNRPALPAGAVVFESGFIGDRENVPVASVRLKGAELRVEAISAERLERAIEIVGIDFGDNVELTGRDLVPIEQCLEEYEPEPPSADPASTCPDPAAARRLLGGVMTDHIREWLDQPSPRLGGQTPREAAAGERREEVIRILRGIENHADRARRRGEPAAEVAWLWGELSIEHDLAA